MPVTKKWHRYLRLWGPDPTADVRDEFDFHLAMRVDELVAHGLSPAAAREEAMRGFGDIDRVKHTCTSLLEAREHMMRRSEWWRGWWQDIRYGLRQLTAYPLSSAMLIGTLGLSIGATVSIFSVVNAVLIEPLPYADGDRIVIVWETARGLGSASAGHFHDWTEQGTIFEATAAVQPATYNLADDGEPERVSGARVTGGYFRVAEIPPAVGRYLSAEEVEAGEAVVVLSHELWQRRFNGDTAIVGRPLRLSGEPHTVVGVAPAAYALNDSSGGAGEGGFSAQLWTPLRFSPGQRSNYGNHSFRVLAKLRPGVPVAAAQAEMERVTRDIAVRAPENMQGRGVFVQPLRERLVGGAQAQILVLFVSVALVLVIGCVNIASLLLARATTRRREIAIRAALGGGTARIVRQLLMENMVLAISGGALAIGVAVLGTRFMATAGPASVPRLRNAGLQIEVLVFALGLTFLTGIIFGLLPALRAGRPDLLETLRSEGRGRLARSGRDWTRAVLIVGEIAITVVLLVSAGLFVRSAMKLQHVPLGIDAENVLTARVALPAPRYQDASVVASAFGRMLEHLRGVRSIEHAGASTTIPLGGGSIDAGLTVEGRTVEAGSRLPYGHVRLVTAGYLEGIGVTLRRGRLLRESDMTAGGPRVLVINELLASQLWPGEDPLGKRLSGWTEGEQPEWREVVGVVGDIWAFGLSAPPEPELFIPYTQAPAGSWNSFQRSMVLVARVPPAGGDAADYSSALRNAVWSVDKTLPLYDVRTMEDRLSASLSARRFLMLLLSGLAATGVLLAAVGIYGVIAYFVTERTAEIGLRLALGATSGSVITMVLRHSAWLAAAGLAVGLVMALAATQVLGSQLFEIQPNDLSTYVLGTLTLLGITLTASALPAMRAARIDPARTLGGN